MNALVSDQLARFRKIIGGDKFREIFTSATYATRTPHFGMYTGRTPYSGDAKPASNKELAATFRENYLVDQNADADLQRRQLNNINGLKSINKYPARFSENGLEVFIENLEKNIHRPSPYDAELITRFEIQNCPPDIVITNYSMLEYMLMRQREANIWNKTKEWLDASTDNRLLIVLDEAHMYRGSAGGEILIVNMGRSKNGFNVCKKCGGAEVAEPNRNNVYFISQPFRANHAACSHDGTVATGIFLGYEFLSDMFMLDILYDSIKLVSSGNVEDKSILRTAVTTLHETLRKAVSLELDIDYNEINGGWRPRILSGSEPHIEMFFYDNLTSGAGYSSIIGSILDKVLDRARSILTDCACSRSCKNCLDNYWNQRHHQLFDRQLGLQLLDFAQFGKLPDEYNKSTQTEFLVPLQKLISEDGSQKSVAFEIIPALRKKPENNNTMMYLNPYDLTDWLPNTFMTYKNL